MTATTAVNKPRRSTGFTIASIIGSDSDTQADKRAESPAFEKASTVKPSENVNKTHEHDSDSDSDKVSDVGRLSRPFLQTQTCYPDKTRTKAHGDPQRDLESAILRRAPGSLHRDSMRDFNFSSANIREGIRTVSSPDSIRHLHENYIHSAGLSSNPAIHPSLGHLEAQRHFRSPMTCPPLGGYPGQVPVGPGLHPMLMGAARELRHMYPYMADRYPSCFLPRYGSKLLFLT